MIAKIQRFGHFWTPPTLSRPLCGKLICRHIKHRLIAGKDETHVKKSTKGWRRKHGVHNPSPSTLWPAYGHYHLVYRLSCNFFFYISFSSFLRLRVFTLHSMCHVLHIALISALRRNGDDGLRHFRTDHKCPTRADDVG